VVFSRKPSSTNKTDLHDIAEIFLNVALNTELTTIVATQITLLVIFIYTNNNIRNRRYICPGFVACKNNVEIA
jgi:hypothetical protein